MNLSNSENPKVSIGLPVYNGDQFIRKRLETLLLQTFTDFELIISDNASTDKTQKICEDYVRKDNRVNYFRQNENRGPSWNFKFVLQQAKSEFFVWAGVDDYWESTFLEKNIDILQKNRNFIGSLCKIRSQDSNQKQNSGIKNIIKKILFPIGPTGLHSITGTYYDKVRFYLKNSSCSIFYSVYRTRELKKGIINDEFLGSDWAENLIMLRFGDINIIEEELMFKSNQGVSSKDIISLSFIFNKGVTGKIFPWFPFTFWCTKNLGLKIFFGNIDYFLLLNYIGLTAQLKKIWLKIKNE